jgi:arylformamidase
MVLGMPAWYDLSHPYFDDMPRGHRLVSRPRVKRILLPSEDSAMDDIQITELHTINHVGTHIDAAAHVFRDGETIGEMAVDRFTGTGVIVDLPCAAMQRIEVTDISASDPAVRQGDIVFLRTGWGARFTRDTRDEYLSWPYLDAELADWLLDRGVRMLGVDTCSPDPPRGAVGSDRTLPIHRKLLGHGVPIAENLNLEGIYKARCTIFAFPLNLETGDGGPARVVARSD